MIARPECLHARVRAHTSNAVHVYVHALHIQYKQNEFVRRAARISWITATDNKTAHICAICLSLSIIPRLAGWLAGNTPLSMIRMYNIYATVYNKLLLANMLI